MNILKRGDINLDIKFDTDGFVLREEEGNIFIILLRRYIYYEGKDPLGLLLMNIILIFIIEKIEDGKEELKNDLDLRFILDEGKSNDTGEKISTIICNNEDGSLLPPTSTVNLFRKGIISNTITSARNLNSYEFHNNTYEKKKTSFSRKLNTSVEISTPSLEVLLISLSLYIFHHINTYIYFFF